MKYSTKLVDSGYLRSKTLEENEMERVLNLVGMKKVRMFVVNCRQGDLRIVTKLILLKKHLYMSNLKTEALPTRNSEEVIYYYIQ